MFCGPPDRSSSATGLAHKSAADILRDLAATTPGQEGKWFAAAKDAGLYEEGLELASASPCDPSTLTRAARDLGATQPAFALGAGLLALRRVVEGYDYEITGADVLAAYLRIRPRWRPPGGRASKVRPGSGSASWSPPRHRAASCQAIRRLDAQLDRVRRLFELGEYDEETFILKRAEITDEQARLREQAEALQGRDNAEWCRAQLFDLLDAWDAAEGAQRTTMLSGLFERIEAHIAVPDPGTKFRTKRQADAVARLLADHGHEIEWVRRNFGAQREMTWNVRLANGTEVHNAAGVERLGLAVPRAAWPAVGRVQVTAVPKEGWRRFFEYVPLERETGLEPATSTLGRSRSAR
jgi:hypothetical protein